ncbi:hypothetical protein U0070_018155, partial [Myodes glareolus]
IAYINGYCTGLGYTLFCLLGIPGLEDQHMWVSLPFFISHVTALLGNSLLIFIILTRPGLHGHMDLFLCVLALAIFWFHAGETSPDPCITNRSTFISESGILLAMAFGRYIAICYPLKYTTLLPNSLIGKIGGIVFLRSHGTIFPTVLLLKRLMFCRTSSLLYTALNICYGSFVLMSTVTLDVVLIFISYIPVLHAIFYLPSQDACHKALVLWVPYNHGNF